MLGKDNKKTVIVLVVIIVVLVAIIVYLLLNNGSKDNSSENNYSNTANFLANRTANVAKDGYVVIDANNTNTSTSAYVDRYANLTTEQINKMIEERSMDNVSIAIKEGTLTKEGATIVVTDKNDYTYRYGEEFNIQKQEDGEWKDLQTKDMYFLNDTNNLIREDRTTQIILNWKYKYGELEAGHYKLNLEVTQNDSSKATVSTEFDIQ